MNNNNNEAITVFVIMRFHAFASRTFRRESSSELGEATMFASAVVDVGGVTGATDSEAAAIADTASFDTMVAGTEESESPIFSSTLVMAEVLEDADALDPSICGP